MWMFSFARSSNIFCATPACERMPTPTTETLARFASVVIWSAATDVGALLGEHVAGARHDRPSAA